MNSIEIRRYAPSDKKVWDLFVNRSRNATFLHNRGFMDYHADRFLDHSLIVYYKDAPVALFPANECEEEIYSHQGLTYGGLLLGGKCGASLVIDIFESIKEYYKSLSKSCIYYKVVPHIYHHSPSEEDQYALFLMDAKLYARSPSVSIALNNNFQLPGKKCNGAKRGHRHGLNISKVADPISLMNLVAKNLEIRHGLSPVHSSLEMLELVTRFPNNIDIFNMYNSSQELLGGAIIFSTKYVAHAQYLTVSPDAKPLRGMDVLISTLIHRYSGISTYFDFGISSENNGRYLNKGLMSQKEEFGASVVCYDQYLISL